MIGRITIALLMTCFLAGSLSAQARRQESRPAPRGAAMIERLNRMTPEQRQRALDRLPADRRARVEERLERLNSMPPPARERLRRQYDQFQNLSPERQETVRRAFRGMNQLPENRRPIVRREILRLRNSTAEERASRLDSEKFRSDYNESERKLIRDLADVVPPEP